MPTIGKTLGIILGPRGKMPKPVPPTIDIANMAKSMRKTVKIRSKTTKTIHATVGREEMNAQHIADNIDAIIKRLEGKLERGKLNIGSVYVKTSMGPPMRIL